jgi:hypothetical protein
MAARTNSSWAPRGPRSRSRPSFRMRFRCANRISIFLRSRRDVSKPSVPASDRATSRARVSVRNHRSWPASTDFCNKIDPKRTLVRLAGITGCHLPRTRIHHYAIWAFILCELGAESRSDFIVALFGQFARFTVDFASRPDCKLKSNRIV